VSGFREKIPENPPPHDTKNHIWDNGEDALWWLVGSPIGEPVKTTDIKRYKSKKMKY
jgi:hypothetical protein